MNESSPTKLHWPRSSVGAVSWKKMMSAPKERPDADEATIRAAMNSSGTWSRIAPREQKVPQRLMQLAASTAPIMEIGRYVFGCKWWA